MFFWKTTSGIAALSFAMVLTVSAGCKQSGGGKSSFPVVDIVTSAGTIRAELWPDKAPKTVANFLEYADEGFYDETVFHRCIRGFMIQGGGFTGQLQKKPTRGKIINEADSGLRNVSGTLSMARESAPHSATSQFFINTVDNPKLDHVDTTDAGWGYCVFGQVISGMDVVHAIELAPTVGREAKGMPANPVIIKTIRRVGGPKKPTVAPAKTKTDSPA